MRALNCGARRCVVVAVILETCSLDGGLRREAVRVTAQAVGPCNTKGSSAAGGAGERKTHSLRFDSSFNPVTSEKSADPLES